jgi:prepilin signal peptidase PulO-like enzyme (type II secretory pathway)
MSKTTEPLYSIPARYRRMENMHIVFWLVKDISWCMIWKPLGIAMIFPTLIIAIVISHRTRELKSELAHNLAVTFWISANSYWMVSEFFHFDTIHIWNQFEGKHLALIPFFMGVIVLAHYYLFQRAKEEKRITVPTM